MVNMYPPSSDYGRIFGFRIFDPVKNCNIRTYLRHDARMVACVPLLRRARRLVESIIAEDERGGP